MLITRKCVASNNLVIVIRVGGELANVPKVQSGSA